MGTRRSVQVKQSLKEGETLSLRGLCEGRENRGSETIEEAPESVRGLTGVQNPSSEVSSWLLSRHGRANMHVYEALSLSGHYGRPSNIDSLLQTS